MPMVPAAHFCTAPSNAVNYAVNCDRSDALAHFKFPFSLLSISWKSGPKHDKFVAINIDFTGNDNK